MESNQVPDSRRFVWPPQPAVSPVLSRSSDDRTRLKFFSFHSQHSTLPFRQILANIARQGDSCNLAYRRHGSSENSTAAARAWSPVGFLAPSSCWRKRLCSPIQASVHVYAPSSPRAARGHVVPQPCSLTAVVVSFFISTG